MIKGKAFVWLTVGCMMLAGCSTSKNGTGPSKSETSPSTSNSAPTANVSTEPVTLSIFMDTGAPDQFVQDDIVKPVEKKFPNITLNFVKKGKGTQAQDLVTANNFPDLIYSSPPFLPALGDLGLLYDLNDLVKKNKMDTSKFNKTILDQIKQFGPKGELYALPFYINYTALFYNKDLFDKFGVAYPKDGMNWDDAIALDQKLSREENGVQYKGLSMPGAGDLASQLSLQLVDPKTHQAQLENEGYTKVLQLMQKEYNVSNKDWKSGPDNDATTAMSAAWGDKTQTYVALARSGHTYNWDMVTEPVFSGSTGYVRRVDSHDLLVSSLSKHKDVSFQVIDYLVSKEYQTQITKDGYLTSLADVSMQKDFGANIPELKGKNLQAIFKEKAAPSFIMTKYDTLVSKPFGSYANQAKMGQMDINTALRTANDEANKAIQAAK